MDKYYVYGHYKTGESDIPFYIGKGNGRRAYEKTRQNKHWHSIVDKYGYVVKILAEGLSQEESFWLETQLIGMFGRHDLGNGPLVNHTDGGEGISGYTFSEDSKNKMSSVRKDKSYDEIYGPEKADEIKQKQSISWSSNKHYIFSTGNIPWNAGTKKIVLKKTKEEISENCRKSKTSNKNPRFDHKIYHFVHKDGREDMLTRYSLAEKYPEEKLFTSGLGNILTGKTITYKGWSILKT